MVKTFEELLETGKNGFIYKSMKSWFLNEIYVDRHGEVEKQFIQFIKDKEDGENSLKKLLENNGGTNGTVGELTNMVEEFFELEEESKRKKRKVEHTPETLFKLAQVFLAIGDLRVCAEMIWGATTMAIKEYAGKQQPPIKLDTHNSTKDFCTVLFRKLPNGSERELFLYHWDHAQTCHRVGFYKNWAGAPSLTLAIQNGRKLVEEMKKLPIFTFSEEDLQEIDG